LNICFVTCDDLLLLFYDLLIFYKSLNINKYFVIGRFIAEAVEAILVYTTSPAELLRRKKVKREVLFRYLHGEGVVIAPNTDKYSIIHRILELWGSKAVPLNYLTVSGPFYTRQ